MVNLFRNESIEVVFCCRLHIYIFERTREREREREREWRDESSTIVQHTQIVYMLRIELKSLLQRSETFT